MGRAARSRLARELIERRTGSPSFALRRVRVRKGNRFVSPAWYNNVETFRAGRIETKPAMARATIPSEPILHVDMDAFYASVEARENPDLAGKPVVVGGGGGRGVVMSASYRAREYGIHSAMPMARARRLCPGLVVVSPHFDLYQDESKAIRAIFTSFTPLVEQISLDEAFLDVGGAVRLFGPPPAIAGRVRARVRDERALVCSVGVAPNKFLAKIASRMAKPDGVVHVPADRIREFLDPLPAGALWGVGEQTGAGLDRLGVRTVGELATISPGALERAFGRATAEHLLALAAGRDDRAVVPYEPAKQVSAEETFERDLDARADVHRELLRLADRVAGRLRAGGLSARTVTIKVRFSDFKTITRSKTLDEATDGEARLYEAARALYERLSLHRPRIRLLGVAASGLVAGSAPEQLRIGERDDRWRDADKAIDGLRRRFGSDAVARAAVAEHRPRVTRKDDGENR
jgi:DNA polymerase-4